MVTNFVILITCLLDDIFIRGNSMFQKCLICGFKVIYYKHTVLYKEYTQNTNQRKWRFLLTMGHTSCISFPNNHLRWQTISWTEWGSNLHEKILENIPLAVHCKMQTKEEIQLSKSRRMAEAHHLYQAERKRKKILIKGKTFQQDFLGLVAVY